MKDARTHRRIDSPPGPRARRAAAAVVAQYLHELSTRHGRSRRTSPAAAERLGARTTAAGQEAIQASGVPAR